MISVKRVIVHGMIIRFYMWGRIRCGMSEPLIMFDEMQGVAVGHVKRPSVASFSMLDSWRACPARWLGDRLMPKPVEWNDPLTLGSLAHAALELACQTPEVDAPDWLTLCEQAPRVERERNQQRGWGADPIPEHVLMSDGRFAVESDWVKAAARKLQGFVLSDALDRQLTPYCMEELVEATIYDIPLRGMVDYRDQDGTIVDWKTGHVPAYQSGRLRHADQLRTYRLLLNAHNVEVRAARDVYVESHAWVEANLSDGECAQTLEWMRVAWSELQTASGDDGVGVFELKPSALCGWCPLAGACPKANIRSAKAKTAARSSVQENDPRIGFIRTHANTGKNNGSSRMVNLLDIISGVQPVIDAQAQSTGLDKTVKNNDPWLSDAGRQALAKWGVQSDTRTRSDQSSTSFQSETETVTGESQTTMDPWAQPQASSSDNSQTVEKPVNELRLVERKPYDPSLLDGKVNTAGYGFTHMIMLTTYASLLADGHDEWIQPIRDRLLLVEWTMAREAFGMIVPTISGLDTSSPDKQALYAWLDSTLCRDSDRVLHMILDADSLLKPGETGSLDACLDRITCGGRMGVRVLQLVADTFRA